MREHIVAYRIDGALFFAAAHRFLLELADVTDVKVVILRMSRVTAIDATGALVLKDAITKLEHRHITVLISGAKPSTCGRCPRWVSSPPRTARSGTSSRPRPERSRTPACWCCRNTGTPRPPPVPRGRGREIPKLFRASRIGGVTGPRGSLALLTR